MSLNLGVHRAAQAPTSRTVSGKEAASAGFGIVALVLVSKSENARPPSFTCTWQRPLRTRADKPACTERPGGTSLGMEASPKGGIPSKV